MDVHIDQARTDDLAGGVHSTVSLDVRLRTDSMYVFSADPKLRYLVDTLRRVDDAAIGDAQDVHGVNCSRNRLSEISFDLSTRCGSP